jgi:hypothetical protein
MEWFRHNPKVAAATGSLALLLVIALIWFFVRGGGPVDEPSVLGDPLPSATTTPLKPLPTLTAVPTPGASPSTSIDQKVAQAMAGIGKAGSGTNGSLSMPGLQGNSISKTLPRHELLLLVHSEGKIGTVGWVIPTTSGKTSGVDKNVGSHWRHATRVYGDPDYAQIWLQAGFPGTPITCEIWVDGKLREKKSTEGPYGQLLCQG